VISPMTIKGGLLVSVALAGMSVIHAVGGWNQQNAVHSGPVLASTLTQSAGPETVLLGGSVPTSFIESLRRADSDRHFVILSSASTATQGSQTEELRASMDQVREVLTREEAKYVVVSDAASTSKLESSLRALLCSDARFKLLGTFPVGSNGSDSQISQLYLYENVGNSSATVHYVPVRMVSLNGVPATPNQPR